MILIKCFRLEYSALETKKISPVELMLSFLAISESLENTLNVWVTMNPELAMDSARICESEINSGLYRGPLHGIPIGIKDIGYQGNKAVSDYKVPASIIEEALKKGPVGTV